MTTVARGGAATAADTGGGALDEADEVHANSSGGADGDEGGDGGHGCCKRKRTGPGSGSD